MYQKVKKTFRVVGIKGNGAFANLGTEVPKLSQHFLGRMDEIKDHSGTEIALFEPKRDANHIEGHYYVGLIVNEILTDVPFRMVYIETDQDYVTTRGKINNIGSLHNQLLKWSIDRGYKRDLESYIIETYHPMENGEEEVEIYLPILI
ncbi:GyrI-like domain-containing protein [Heyndrickxia sporothermodurans]